MSRKHDRRYNDRSRPSSYSSLEGRRGRQRERESHHRRDFTSHIEPPVFRDRRGHQSTSPAREKRKPCERRDYSAGKRKKNKSRPRSSTSSSGSCGSPSKEWKSRKRKAKKKGKKKKRSSSSESQDSSCRAFKLKKKRKKNLLKHERSSSRETEIKTEALDIKEEDGPGLKKSKSSLEAINKVLQRCNSSEKAGDEEVQEIIIENKKSGRSEIKLESSDDDLIIVHCQTATSKEDICATKQISNEILVKKEYKKSADFNLNNFCFVNISQSCVEFGVSLEEETFQSRKYNLESGEKIEEKIATFLEESSVSPRTLVIPNIPQLNKLNFAQTEHLFSGWLDLKTLATNRNFPEISSVRCQRQSSDGLSSWYDHFIAESADDQETTTSLMKDVIKKVLAAKTKLQLERFIRPIRGNKNSLISVVKINFSSSSSHLPPTISSISYSLSPDHTWDSDSLDPPGHSEEEILKQFLESLQKSMKDKGEFVFVIFNYYQLYFSQVRRGSSNCGVWPGFGRPHIQAGVSEITGKLSLHCQSSW